MGGGSPGEAYGRRRFWNHAADFGWLFRPCESSTRLYNARAFPLRTNQRGDSRLMFCHYKFCDSKQRSNRVARAVLFLTVMLEMMAGVPGARAQAPDITSKLSDFDAYMVQVLKDWNTPGIGVGIVVHDKLVFAKGYGYRDYDKKLPFTPATLCQIASNYKLFNAVAAGMLVEEGKLNWDKPVRESVPTIQFYNDQLNNNVTLRDMRSEEHT